MSTRLWRWPRQIVAFARKELAEVIRQPRLLMVMVLGPFAIMALFGVGYDDSPPKLRTLFVMPSDSPFTAQVETYVDQMSTYVDVVGVVDDVDAARRELRANDVDVLVEFPADPLGDVMGGNRAMVNIVHTRLDPIERTAISFVSALAIDQINSEVLARIVTEGQDLGDGAVGVVSAAQTSLTAVRTAVAAGDQAAAQQASADLAQHVDAVAVAASLSGSVSTQLGQDSSAGDYAGDLRNASSKVSQDVAQAGTDPAALSAELDDLDRLLALGATDYASVLAVDPHVLVQPLDSQVQLAVSDADKITDWYAPAAVVLMLQQFGVAFGALTYVRERQLGIDDVFRIAPVGASASIIGKMIAFVVVGTVIAAVLTTMVVLGLGVPIIGSMIDLAVVMVLTLFASISLGLMISLASKSDAQAVQYTMIILLASLFFSGFFLSLGQMANVSKVVPWLLPASYGMSALRDVMLRGASPDPRIIIGLAAFGVALFALAYGGARRRVSPRS